MEFDLSFTDTANSVTHSAVFSALQTALGTTSPAGISKYRISSLVVDPIAAAGLVPYFNVDMGISGLHYQSPNNDKPLRIRLGKDVGDDGMWLVNDGAALADAVLPGTEAISDPFITLVVPSQADSWGTTVHVRCAWMDPT